MAVPYTQILENTNVERFYHYKYIRVFANSFCRFRMTSTLNEKMLLKKISSLNWNIQITYRQALETNAMLIWKSDQTLSVIKQSKHRQVFWQGFHDNKIWRHIWFSVFCSLFDSGQFIKNYVLFTSEIIFYVFYVTEIKNKTQIP